MVKWKKANWVVLLIFVFIAAVSVSGCGGKNEDAGGKINIAGSTSVQPLAEELAQAFEEGNSEIKVDVAGGGSSAGIKAAQDGTADIGTSSRELKEEEKAAGLVETLIAKDGIAVIVSTKNQMSDMTLEQIKKIYTGEIRNWQEVGGKDARITVVNRDEASGTRGAFQEIVLGKEGNFVADAVIQSTTGAVRTTVAQDENAIGYISIGSLDTSVKTVQVDGVEATETNVLNGSYKITRPFLFLTKGAPDAAIKTFIDYILSTEGQQIVAEEFIPVK